MKHQFGAILICNSSHYVTFNIAPLWSPKERQSVPEKKKLARGSSLDWSDNKASSPAGLEALDLRALASA